MPQIVATVSLYEIIFFNKGGFELHLVRKIPFIS